MFRSRASLREEWETQQELRQAARSISRICAIVEQLVVMRQSAPSGGGGGLLEGLGAALSAIPRRAPAPVPASAPASVGEAPSQVTGGGVSPFFAGQVVNGQVMR